MINGKVLVNRPLQQALDTVEFLATKGVHALAAPSQSIIPVPHLDPLDVDYALITSANALPSLKNQKRSLSLFTVGKATADSARAMGFENIQYADGDGASLIEMCKNEKLDASRGVLISGQGHDGMMYGDPIVKALGIKRVTGYKVSLLKSLSMPVCKSLEDGEVKMILVYSGQGARAFLELGHTLLKDHAAEIRVVCLAERIADVWRERSAELGIKKWRDIRICMPPHKIDFRH